MIAPKTRSAAVTAYCRQCIHDSAAFGTWREQVAACPAIACPLWRFRPLQDAKSCPHWIRSRDPDDLAEGWTMMEQAAAVRAMRASIADKVCAHRKTVPRHNTRIPAMVTTQGGDHARA